MSFAFRLIQNMIRLALLIGAAGGLVDATIAMSGKAADAHKYGLISLGRLNRQLHGVYTQ